ncbi:Vacuolar protein sorting-associated protein 9a [Vanrija pseudolonga]|uniref:Vacuolar protein sorting-associated protein 9a n=1 Tax=Vanrija pseudolonga TaxID=143232 RepID=A0AAF0XZI2_9TREE|nr:Vacuolar protein sorting-associated protein 9a [Vanrija pseudolonga]
MATPPADDTHTSVQGATSEAPAAVAPAPPAPHAHDDDNAASPSPVQQEPSAASASDHPSPSPAVVVDLTSPPRPAAPPAPATGVITSSASTDAVTSPGDAPDNAPSHSTAAEEEETNGHAGDKQDKTTHTTAAADTLAPPSPSSHLSPPSPTTPLTPASSRSTPAPASPSKQPPMSLGSKPLPASPKPAGLAMAESPPRRSSLNAAALKRPALSLVTPAAATPAQRAVSGSGTPPGAPAKAPLGALRTAPDLAEFDPFATPAPAAAGPASAAVPRRPASGSGSNEATPTQARPQPQPHQASRSATPDTPGASTGASRPRRIVRAESGDAESTGDEPVFNFAGFLKDLRSRPADPIARYLKSFLTNFAKKPFTINEQIKLVRDFLSFIAEKMRVVEPWKSQSPAEFDNALEAMEKLVMNRLYPFTFTPQLTNGQTITTDDLERDAVFEQRVRLFSWVRGYHLDVPENEATQGFLGFAEQELLKINHYKAPRDKMICILNCCKVIFGLIRHTAGSDATSADAFVPILIFVVLRAAPENMLSNIEYISRFRNAEKLQGEAGYYLSSLQGAIQFIETMDASSLSNITQEEFESNVEKAIQELPSSPSSPRARSSIPSGNNEISPWATTPGEEPARQLALPATAAALDGTKRFFQRTGDAAKEAVSRPLNTISKILQDMQQQATAESSSESGDDEVVDRWAPGGPRDRQHEHRAHHPHGSMPVAVPAPQYIHGRGEAAPPSHLLAQLGISPGDPTPRYVAWRDACSGTPREPTPDYAAQMHHTLEASHEEYAREQARAANVMTLHQMFPALDEEIVDAVLYSCGDDLGHAIDRWVGVGGVR